MKRWVLIVDDHRDVRQVLRTGLATLDPDIKIVDVPSGEEAMLLIMLQPPDLMITDVGLPGISGLDLLRRARSRNPDLKLILITGIEDRNLQQEVKDSGAQAYFFKPIQMGEFLATAEGLLGISGKTKPGAVQNRGLEPAVTASRPAFTPAPLRREEAVTKKVETPTPPVPPAAAPSTPAERLALLLAVAGVRAALLLNAAGQVIEQAGAFLPVSELEPSLVEAWSLAGRITALLEKEPADHLQYFNGKLQSIVLASVDHQVHLAVVLLPGMEGERLSEALLATRQAARDLLTLLPENPVPTPEPQAVPDLGPLPSLEDLFGKDLDSVKNKDVDAFWDDALAGVDESGMSTDTLSFDEARQLGLGLDEDKA